MSLAMLDSPDNQDQTTYNGGHQVGALQGLNQEMTGQRRRLEYNPQSGMWEPSTLDDSAYDKKYAANSARGYFKTLGRTEETF